MLGKIVNCLQIIGIIKRLIAGDAVSLLVKGADGGPYE